MRLIKLSQFRRLVYAPGSAPSLATLRRRIYEIPGGRRELGQYWVDLDEYEGIRDQRVQIANRERELAQDPLLKGLV